MKYLRAEGLTFAAFGERVGLTRTSIHRIVSGAQTPKPDTAHAIVAATGGAVTLEDLYPTPTIAAE